MKKRRGYSICAVLLFLSLLSVSSVVSTLRRYDVVPVFDQDKSFEQVILEDIWYDADIAPNLVSRIDNAEDHVEFVMFKFDSRSIADSLIRAAERGVTVSVLIDARSTQYKIEDTPIEDYLLNGSEERIALFRYNDAPNIMHNKVILIDDYELCTGSQNMFDADIKNNYEVFFDFNIGEKTCSIIKAQIKNLKMDERTCVMNEGMRGGGLVSKTETGIDSTDGESDMNSGRTYNSILDGIWFSPECDSRKTVVSVIESADHEIDVAMGFFRDETIRRALLRANKRGVGIRILMDDSYQDFAGLLEADGFDIRVYSKADSLMHYKTMLIDEDMVFTGSLNFFERSLDSDREMFMLLDSEKLNCKLKERFDYMWADKHCISPDAASISSRIKYYVKLLLSE